MVFTKNFSLPTEEELTVEEVNVSWPVLQAAAVYIGKKCEWKNNEYMLCKQETNDPRKCIEEGKHVTACALEVFREIKKHCQDDFNRYVHCLEHSTGTMQLRSCRKTQTAVDDCVLKNMNIERPAAGEFCKVRIHDSPRPEPEKPKPAEYPDATPPVVEGPYPEAKYSSRSWWNS